MSLSLALKLLLMFYFLNTITCKTWGEFRACKTSCDTNPGTTINGNIDDCQSRDNCKAVNSLLADTKYWTTYRD